MHINQSQLDRIEAKLDEILSNQRRHMNMPPPMSKQERAIKGQLAWSRKIFDDREAKKERARKERDKRKSGT